MKYTFCCAAAFLASAAPVFAGGLDRSGQVIGPLWETGNFVEMSFGSVNPSMSGADKPLGPYVGGRETGNIAESYNAISLAYKHQFNDNWSAAIIMDQPFGSDLIYPADGSLNLGGTSVLVDSSQLTGIVRFAMPHNGLGAHAGVRALQTDANVVLNGAAYGAVNGYELDVDKDTAYGWLAGVSWERPDIAARVALTYYFEIEHEFDVTESGPLVDPDGAAPIPSLPLLDGSSVLKVKAPKSWNLDFQTGINSKTLVFGAIRWVDWSSFRVDPESFVNVTGGGLVDLEDSTTYTLGVARKFTQNWSGTASMSFEKAGNELVSPLAPTNGRKSLILGAIYSQNKLKITTGISYSKLGDALPETGTPDTARAELDDSHAWGVGIKIGYTF